MSDPSTFGFLSIAINAFQSLNTHSCHYFSVHALNTSVHFILDEHFLHFAKETLSTDLRLAVEVVLRSQTF
jgi:hypothetical protein